MEAFLAEFEGALSAMGEEEWEQHRQALIQAKRQKDNSISDEAERFWEQVASRRCGQSSRMIKSNKQFALLAGADLRLTGTSHAAWCSMM